MGENSVGLIGCPSRDSGIHDFKHVKAGNIANVALTESANKLADVLP